MIHACPQLKFCRSCKSLIYPFKEAILKHSIPTVTRRALGATVTAALLVCYGPAVFAATPKDTLVVAWAIDDIITMDPGESFEISAGEVMGNAYDRLLRYDVNDPSKLIADLAKTWSVSADGKTYSFELKPGMKFASGNPIMPTTWRSRTSARYCLINHPRSSSASSV